MRKMLVVLIGFLLVGCANLMGGGRARTISEHRRTGSGIYPTIVNHRHNETELSVRVLVSNDTPLDYYVVLECNFERAGGGYGSRLSTNTITLRMRRFTERHVWVYSSRISSFPSITECEVTRESHPIDSTTVTITRDE